MGVVGGRSAPVVPAHIGHAWKRGQGGRVSKGNVLVSPPDAHTSGWSMADIVPHGHMVANKACFMIEDELYAPWKNP